MYWLIACHCLELQAFYSTITYESYHMNHNEFPVWISFVTFGQAFVLDFSSDNYDVDSGKTSLLTLIKSPIWQIILKSDKIVSEQISRKSLANSGLFTVITTRSPGEVPVQVRLASKYGSNNLELRQVNYSGQAPYYYSLLWLILVLPGVVRL